MADTNAQQAVQQPAEQPAADGSQSPPGQLVKKKFLNGWTAELVCVKISGLENPSLDRQLLDTIPSELIIHYVNAFSTLLRVLL